MQQTEDGPHAAVPDKQAQAPAAAPAAAQPAVASTAEEAPAQQAQDPAAPAQGALQDAEPAAATSSEALFEKARAQDVFWARVKGYPAWPAQQLPAEEAAKWLPARKMGKARHLPVMFFGTYEVAWLPEAHAIPWADGVQMRLPSKARKPTFLLALEEVDSYLGPEQRAPQQWWSSPPASPDFAPEAEPDPAPAPAPEQAPPPAPPAAQADQSPKKPPPPKYERLRRSTWLDKNQRPKRLPRDEISICSCQPFGLAPPAPARGLRSTLAAAALSPAEAPPGSGASPGPASAGPEAGVAVRLQVGPDGAVSSTVAPLDAPAQEPASRGGGGCGSPGAPGRAPPPERLSCGADCQNRLCCVFCDPKSCPCGDTCSNRPFHLLPMPKMETFPTENRGWGVRAAEPIPQGTFVVEYVGEVLCLAEFQKRMQKAQKTCAIGEYMMELSSELVIDAHAKGNISRLINSSCAPNCKAQKWHDAATNETRVGLFAAEDIAPGVELTYDYMFRHAGTSQAASAYRCQCGPHTLWCLMLAYRPGVDCLEAKRGDCCRRCGAKNCRGTMDVRMERFRDEERRIEVYCPASQAYFRGTIKGYAPKADKHRVLYDDGVEERLVLQGTRHRWLPDNMPPLREPTPAPEPALAPAAPGAAQPPGAGGREQAGPGPGAKEDGPRSLDPGSAASAATTFAHPGPGALAAEPAPQAAPAGASPRKRRRGAAGAAVQEVAGAGGRAAQEPPQPQLPDGAAAKRARTQEGEEVSSPRSSGLPQARAEADPEQRVQQQQDGLHHSPGRPPAATELARGGGGGAGAVQPQVHLQQFLRQYQALQEREGRAACLEAEAAKLQLDAQAKQAQAAELRAETEHGWAQLQAYYAAQGHATKLALVQLPLLLAQQQQQQQQQSATSSLPPLPVQQGAAGPAPRVLTPLEVLQALARLGPREGPPPPLPAPRQAQPLTQHVPASGPGEAPAAAPGVVGGPPGVGGLDSNEAPAPGSAPGAPSRSRRFPRGMLGGAKTAKGRLPVRLKPLAPSDAPAVAVPLVRLARGRYGPAPVG